MCREIINDQSPRAASDCLWWGPCGAEQDILQSEIK